MAVQLSKQEVREIFSNALRMVADGFDPDAPDFLNFTFEMFHPFHKLVFLNQLKKLFLKKHFIFDGIKFCYDVTLNESMFDEWDNFRECIDYLFETQQRTMVESKITEF
jgi:hypothetical protein